MNFNIHKTATHKIPVPESAAKAPDSSARHYATQGPDRLRIELCIEGNI